MTIKRITKVIIRVWLVTIQIAHLNPTAGGHHKKAQTQVDVDMQPHTWSSSVKTCSCVTTLAVASVFVRVLEHFQQSSNNHFTINSIGRFPNTKFRTIRGVRASQAVPQ
jgi:hypothetical protein